MGGIACNLHSLRKPVSAFGVDVRDWRRIGWGILFFFCSGGSALAADEFVLGADLSYVNEMDDCGVIYRDAGKPVDAYELFADKGANLVRLRLWHSPEWTDYSTLEDVKRSIRRAKAADLRVLLDFHYSDDWADPGDQIIPKAWAKIASEDALAEAVYEYTADTLIELAREGLTPDLVQVGNETNTEILLHEKVSEGAEINWVRNVKLINAGIAGVAEAGRVSGETPAAMLHIAQPENVEPWFDAALKAGLIDFDFIGLSYYPKWSSRDMESLGRTIQRLRHKYKKKIVIVETAYPFTLKANDQAGNILGDDALIPQYPATLSGQKSYLTDLTQTVMENDGQGVVYWEPAWVSNDCSTRWGKGSHWENNAFFDYEKTEAHSGFDFYTASYAEPVDVALEIEADGAAGRPLYLWASFLAGNDFAVRMSYADGVYKYSARLPRNSEFSFQVYATADLSEKLIKDAPLDEHGFAVVQVLERPRKIKMSVDLN